VSTASLQHEINLLGATDDEGVSWRNLSDNLPSVMVADLAYRLADRSLYAATYGRSARVRQLT